jgi:hypothetical protein
MKCLRILAALPLLFVLCGHALADGLDNGGENKGTVITVDEYGNGTITTKDGTTLLQGKLNKDNVLTYTLPFTKDVYSGDVELRDKIPGTTTTVLGDLIRFTDDNKLLFYSDSGPTDPVDAPADKASFPDEISEGAVKIPEVGPEGNNGAFYTPGAGKPGGIGENEENKVTYHFISDGVVPEPSSIALLMSGLLSGCPFILRRRRP